jgi:hypothetical protein
MASVADPVQAVNSSESLPDIDVVKHHKVRVAVLDEGGAVRGVLQDPAKREINTKAMHKWCFGNSRANTVGAGAVQPVRDKDATADREDVGVEVVVDQAELLAGGERAGGAIDFAGERLVGRVVCVLPHLQII